MYINLAELLADPTEFLPVSTVDYKACTWWDKNYNICTDGTTIYTLLKGPYAYMQYNGKL